MGKFTFRLATLLRVRENDRDRHRAELAQAHRADEILAQRQEQLKRRRDELLARCREAAGPGQLDVEALIGYRRRDELITTQQDELRRQRQLAALEVDRRREALVGADREVQVLERLEEKQRDRHREHEERRQTKMLDEIASNCRAA